jgi:hypothetical protein
MGHKIYKKRKINATSKCGAKQTLACQYNASVFQTEGEGIRKRAPDAHITKENKCDWFIQLEESTEGWVIAFGCITHNKHPMAPKTLNEEEKALTYSKYKRKIPDQLIDALDSDMLEDMAPQQIHRTLCKKATKMNMGIGWTIKDVCTHFAPSAAAMALDATGLADLLKTREDELGLRQAIKHAEDQKLEQVFFEVVSAAACRLGGGAYLNINISLTA